MNNLVGDEGARLYVWWSVLRLELTGRVTVLELVFLRLCYIDIR